ncbi:MAG: class I SAM-dependent methyltransferase [Candidatus Bipolaricaulota bacterium]|nr:class I SAM-dependent methyltransferase [Candidatus Bipolaricaulota bacterium]
MVEKEASHVEEEKEKVSRHYDIDPQVFELFLDEHMNYSCAYFEEGEGLEEAQQRKLDIIADKINLEPDGKLLDVGCGWGNTLLYYSENYGCETTGLTIAENQAEEIRKKAAERDLADKISVRVEHFQETSLPPESFDKVIFIGSIVHIEDRAGAAKLTHSLLRDGGRSLISETYLPKKDQSTGGRASNFISEQVFGYGNLITPGEEIRFLEEAGFELLGVENITSHYVKTIGKWLNRVKNRKEEIDEKLPGQSKKLRTYLTLARRALKRRTSLQQQILVRKLRNG